MGGRVGGLAHEAPTLSNGLMLIVEVRERLLTGRPISSRKDKYSTPLCRDDTNRAAENFASYDRLNFGEMGVFLK